METFRDGLGFQTVSFYREPQDLAMADKVVCYRNRAYSDTTKMGSKFQSGRHTDEGKKQNQTKTKKEKGVQLTLFSN